MSSPAAPTLRRAHVQRAVAVLSEVLDRKPADAVLQELFRANRQMGSRDRAQVSALVYDVLRDFRRAEMLAGSRDPAALCAAGLRLNRNSPPEMLEDLALPAIPAPPPEWPDAVRLNLPDWLYEPLVRRHGPEETRALAQALNLPGTVDLRVNTLRATREAARTALADEGLASEPTPLSPLGVRLAKRAALQNTQAFRQGWVEPQDEGSQLLAYLVAPQPDERVADFCAGAGGKTLAMGAAMENRGTLHAFDVSATRLDKLGPRARRAGLSIVQAQVLRGESDPVLEPLHGTLDAVLVDAPCSGTGRLRRNPELRLHEPDLPALCRLQLAILVAAAALVRPGGRLVYATCSLLDVENADVLSAFLSTHPDFSELDAGAVLRAQAVPWDEPRLELLPHRHGTDGFFGALLLKAGIASPSGRGRRESAG